MSSFESRFLEQPFRFPVVESFMFFSFNALISVLGLEQKRVGAACCELIYSLQDAMIGRLFYFVIACGGNTANFVHLLHCEHSS